MYYADEDNPLPQNLPNYPAQNTPQPPERLTADRKKFYPPPPDPFIEEGTEEKKAARFEMITGIIIAFFTAILALAGLAGDSYGQGVLMSEGEKASAYDWYNSKSIKQILTENQKSSLESLIASGQLKEENTGQIQDYFSQLEKILAEYKKQYDEITSSVLPDKGKYFQDSDIELGKTIGALEILIAENAEMGSAADQLQSHLEGLAKEIERYKREKNEILAGSANLDQAEWVQDVNGELGKVIGAQEWEADIEVLDKAGAKMDLATLFLEICLVLGAISLVMQKRAPKWLFLTLCLAVGLVGAVFMGWGMYILWPF